MNFDQTINRHGIYSQKWDLQGGDYIPMWVADMDFPIPPAIKKALEERIKRESFGFTWIYDEVYQAIIDYYKNRYNAVVEKEWIVWVPSLMPGVNLACRMAGGHIMINTPMYPHIRALPKEAHTTVVETPLHEENLYYTMDFEAMERDITPEVKSFVLCNPHNPVGRVFTRDELEELTAFCRKHDLLVVSDEIHSDLVLEGEHIPYFLLSGEAAQHSVTLASASKTYNLPSVPYAYAIIPNKELREKYVDTCIGLFAPPPTFPMLVIETAYTKCEDWRLELIDYLRANRDYMEERIAKIPGLAVTHNEGSYLAWVDCRETGLEDPWTFFREKAGVNFNNGVDFAAPGFVRLNFGCPRSQLKDALDHMEAALAEDSVSCKAK